MEVSQFAAEAVDWLRDKPRTIIIDRLDFILNRENFQIKINQAAESGKPLELPKSKTLFLIKLEGFWRRAIIKFFNERTNTFVLICVDSSLTVDFRRNEFPLRSIEVPEVLNEPWCRLKCYVFGIEINESEIPDEIFDLYDDFFKNSIFTTVALPIEQKNKEVLRFTYICDFVKKTPEGNNVSFRKLLLETSFGKIAYVNELKNQILFSAVEKLLHETNELETLHGNASTLQSSVLSTESKTLNPVNTEAFFRSTIDQTNELVQVVPADFFDAREVTKYITFNKQLEVGGVIEMYKNFDKFTYS